MRRLRIAAASCLAGFVAACGSTAGDRLSCDDPGVGTPSAIGVDIATGRLVWSWCPGDTIAPFVRTTGAARGGRPQLSAEEAAVVKLLTARLDARTGRRAA